VIKGNDGKMITDAEKVKSRWKDYFEGLYNDPSPVDETTLSKMVENSDKNPCQGILMDEVTRAARMLKDRKAPEADNITAEEIKAATEEGGLLTAHQLLTRIWEAEIFPTEWKQAIIIPIYKKKDKLYCNNYWGVSLLCHYSKILTSIYLWKESREERRKAYRYRASRFPIIAEHHRSNFHAQSAVGEVC